MVGAGIGLLLYGAIGGIGGLLLGALIPWFLPERWLGVKLASFAGIVAIMCFGVFLILTLKQR